MKEEKENKYLGIWFSGAKVLIGLGTLQMKVKTAVAERNKSTLEKYSRK